MSPEAAEVLKQILANAFPDAQLVECRELPGGVASRAAVCRLRQAGGEEERMVVRRPGPTFASTALQVAAAEFTALRAAEGLGIPIPRPRHLDEQVPAIVLDYVVGALEFSPPDLSVTLEQLARQLATIHSVSAEHESLTGLPQYRRRAGAWIERRVRRFDDSLHEGRLREVARSLWPWPQHNASVLLHGDFWPGNVLFRDGQLVAVLDWEDTALGDPLCDVAIARLDLLWAFGIDAMYEFTHYYRSQTDWDWSCMPHWDLYAALRPVSQLAHWATAYASPAISRSDVTVSTMTLDHRRFVAQALRELGVSSVDIER
jgi:aminoglycoside phosphotransferase (APT) family kinase protein